jgi:hypothetical protein
VPFWNMREGGQGMTGDNLKALRLAAGLSRPALAKLAGLHPDSVKYWEAKQQGYCKGHAPRLILTALGRTDLLKSLTPVPSRRRWGNFSAYTRAWGGVLSAPRRLPAPKQCGATTRKGAPCKAKPLPGKRRCKFHGGLSTGPKTPEGRERIAEAQRRRWARWRASKANPCE